MKAFEYVAPTTLDDALAALAAANGGARALAGGTDLIVQMRAGRLTPEQVVDLKKIPELNELRIDQASGLTIGAAVPCYKIYGEQAIRRAYPSLIDAATIIGGIGIQGRASLGGNLCNASPSGDSIPAMIVLGATANIASANGRRSLPVAQFCTGPGRNALEPGEILVSITFPSPQPNSGAHYQRFIPRNEMDIAIVGVGAAVELDANGQTIRAGRVALGAVGPTPIVVEAANDAVAGKPATSEGLDAVVEAARAAARPITDMRGTAAQRRHLVGVLTRRVLLEAIARAKGEGTHAH